MSKSGDEENPGETPERRAGLSYRFSHAVVRVPGESVVKGLRSEDRGDPSLEAFRAEHRAYMAALERAGLVIEALPALEAYPDSVFVEDAALCLPEGAVVLRPGAATRRGEAAILEPVLKSYYRDLRRIEGGASIDGGDILVTDSLVLVGLSQRTDRAGFDALSGIVESWGYRARALDLPAGIFHLKSDCAVLDEESVLLTDRLAGHEGFAAFRRLRVPAGEEPAANAVRINDRLLVASGFPRTAELLSNAGYRVERLPVSQAAMLDGGLSCMSLRFAPKS